jgi:guanine deaminase
MGEGPPPRPADAGGSDRVICPGFVDTHLHLPQYASIGYDGLDLLDWLERVIFPAEMAWGDEAVAQREATAACRRLLEAGTLGFAGYLTSHTHALDAAAAALDAVPLRALVGQVLMDRAAPDGLLGHEVRLGPSVNPRFAIACTDDLLARAGTMASDAELLQTHLAEDVRECERVAELFPGDDSYAAIYDRHDLLTERTLLGHCLHLSDDEWALIAERRSVAVHCPTANVFLRAGLFDLAAARRHGARVALGSDVAAGPDVAMPRVARAMIDVAKIRAMTASDAVVPSPAEAWRMITEENADALGWSDAGRLEVGASADLLVLKTPFASDADLVSRLIYTWRNDYIVERIVSGRLLT